MSEPSVQERYAPHNACFGCGPANSKGLRIRSFIEGEDFVARWTPEPHHEAFPGVLNGGICGALLDCHCNWRAATALMAAQGVESPPCTVTAEYTVKLLRPTPTDRPLTLRARVVSMKGDRSATVEGTIETDGEVSARCSGVFVAVKPGHPAYHRW
ncbi:MAG TPA: PaaI family thioesterase [Myxococcales bacterium]|nr:PaaI family thioesterase [Myxococcales bacterium]